ALGVFSTAVVAGGPRAVGYADRFAVPVMAIAGAVLTYGALNMSPRPPAAAASRSDLLWGLDVVIGYQVSWLLMFADYSRYTRSGRAAATAVWAGLALPAFWLMPLGMTLGELACS